MPAARSPDAADSSAGGPPRKKMRQGTHSCIECRRRKIKCIFREDRPNVCNECFGRGISCVDQESAADTQTAETRQSLRERVAQLESMVRSITRRIDADDDYGGGGGGGGSSSGSGASDAGKEAPPHHNIADLVGAAPGLEHAPIMALFNNGLIAGQVEAESAPTTTTLPHRQEAGGRGSSADDRIRQKLLSVVPSTADIEVIFDESQHWHKIWRYMLPDLILVDGNSFPNFVKNAIAGGPLLKLCKALLCLSLALQQIQPSVIQKRLNLPRSGEDIMYHYVTTIEDSILSNDRRCANLDALECIILLTKLDAHAGRPRKAWLAHRRALNFALLLGLHRASSWVKTDADPVSGPRRRSIFLALFTGDRYMSLMLGLPYALSDAQCDIDRMITECDYEPFPYFSARHLIYTSKLTGKLIDRSQNPELATLDSTLRCDQELEELAHGLPPLPNHPSGTDAFDRAYYLSLAHFVHHLIRSVLHLPFFLKSGTDRRYEFNRQAALESAREMIHAYLVLRASADGGYCMCKVLDFQVFTACVMLLLNRFGFTKLPGAVRDPVRERQDEKLILEVKGLFEQAGSAAQGRAGDSVQDQGAKLLGMFMHCDDRSSCAEDVCPCSNDAPLQVVVPYFGRITVRPGKDVEHLANQACAAPTPSSTASGGGHHRGSLPTSTFSAAGSPSGPWQLPTPPQGASARGSAASGSGSQNCASPASSASNNPFMTFDPFNVPLADGPAASALPPGGGGPGYFDPLLNMGTGPGGAAAAPTPDWMGGGTAWPSFATGGGEFDFELDNNWNWIMNNGGPPQSGAVGK